MVRSHWLRVCGMRLIRACHARFHCGSGTPIPWPRRIPQLAGLFYKRHATTLTCRDILPVSRFQVLFHSPSGVLFTFPSRYFCTIGSLEYSALDRGRPGFGQGSSCPALLRYRIMETLSFRLRDCHPLRRGCPAASAMNAFSSNSTGHPHAALQPRYCGLGSSAFARRYLRNLF